jgi:hypothetical protein
MVVKLCKGEGDSRADARANFYVKAEVIPEENLINVRIANRWKEKIALYK